MQLSPIFRRGKYKYKSQKKMSQIAKYLHKIQANTLMHVRMYANKFLQSLNS